MPDTTNYMNEVGWVLLDRNTQRKVRRLLQSVSPPAGGVKCSLCLQLQVANTPQHLKLSRQIRNKNKFKLPLYKHTTINRESEVSGEYLSCTQSNILISSSDSGEDWGGEKM